MGSMASTASSKTLESWTLAAEWITESGIPLRSTTMWRFEPCLPLSVGFAPVLLPPGGGDARRVQRRPLPVDLLGLAQPIQELAVQLLPHARFLPLLEASPTSHARFASHLLGQHLPGYAALQDEQDAAEGGPIVDAGPAALRLRLLLGQQRFYHFPQFVRNEFFSHALILPTTRFC